MSGLDTDSAAAATVPRSRSGEGEVDRCTKTSAGSRERCWKAAAVAHGDCGVGDLASRGSFSGGATVRKFTSNELKELNRRHNTHVAYRGKVSVVKKSRLCL